VKKGDKVLIRCLADAPIWHEWSRRPSETGRLLQLQARRLSAALLDADEEQIKAQAKYDLYRMKDMDCYIGIRGPANTMEMSDVPSAQLKLWSKYYATPVHFKTRVPKTRWVVLRWPNDSMAQNAHKPLYVFEDFYFKVCTLDYAKMSKAMDPLKELMDKTDRVEIKAPDRSSSRSRTSR
jgi:aminopeptidase